MNLKLTSSFFFLLCLLQAVSFGHTSSEHGSKPKLTPFSARSCDLGPRYFEGKYWLLHLKPELFKNDAEMDIYAYWLMYDHSFRIVRSYVGERGFYVVDYIPPEEMLIINKGVLLTPNYICDSHRTIIDFREKTIRNQLKVSIFSRLPYEVYFYPNGSKQGQEMTLNPSSLSNPTNDWEKVLAPFAVNYVNSDDEKEKHLSGLWTDLRDTERPYNISELDSTYRTPNPLALD